MRQQMPKWRAAAIWLIRNYRKGSTLRIISVGELWMFAIFSGSRDHSLHWLWITQFPGRWLSTCKKWSRKGEREEERGESEWEKEGERGGGQERRGGKRERERERERERGEMKREREREKIWREREREREREEIWRDEERKRERERERIGGWVDGVMPSKTECQPASVLLYALTWEEAKCLWTPYTHLFFRGLISYCWYNPQPMRNDHSIAGTTILQMTLEDADNTQFYW